MANDLTPTPPVREPIAVIATAPGRGAVGIVRISGPQLAPLVQALCGQSLVARHATYLPFRASNGETIDQGLALFFPAPHSFTGEDVVELQAHGGPVVLQLLLARCLEAGQAMGVRLARPGEFSERAFLNNKLDLAQAEAIADLIDASTEAAARSASRSLSGAFSTTIGRLRDALIHLRMLVEATLDFPEEDIDFLQRADATGQLQRLQQQLQQVRQQARQGALLREGIKLVIAGQPNVGKSSLLNALAGAELAIVTPIAGTTRDVLGQTIQIEGVPLHIVDTAGLRESEDLVEQMGVARAWAQIEGADAVLWLRDLTRADAIEYRAQDAELARILGQKLSEQLPLLTVWNKCDQVPAVHHNGGSMAQPAQPPQHQGKHPADPCADRSTTMAAALNNAAENPSAAQPTLYISAKTGAGLDALRSQLLRIAGWQPGSEGLYMARQRHLDALTQVAQHLERAAQTLAQPQPMLDLMAEELRLAQNALNQITGAFSSDDLLGEIFSRFCIGK